MSQTFRNPGEDTTFLVPAAGVTTGVPLLVGTLFVIPDITVAFSASENRFFSAKLVGIHDLPKVSAQAWTAGQAVYWDDTAKLVTSVSTSNKLIGAATLAAANPTATGVVRLNGVAIP